MALGVPESQLKESQAVRFRFHPFGDRIHGQHLRDLRGRADDAEGAQVRQHLAHEDAIDLEPIRRQFLKIQEGGLPGPEIVQCDVYAECPALREDSGDLLEVVDHLGEAPLGLAEEDRVGVVRHFGRVQHGGDAAEDHRHPPFAKLPGDLEGPRQLRGQHRRDRHQVGGSGKIDRLQVLVGELQLDLGGDGGGEDHRSVRRQVEFGLPVELGPARVDQLQLHRVNLHRAARLQKGHFESPYRGFSVHGNPFGHVDIGVATEYRNTTGCHLGIFPDDRFQPEIVHRVRRIFLGV